MLLPLILLVIAEVALERLLAPGAVDRVRDGCECRDGLVLAWVAEELMGGLEKFEIYVERCSFGSGVIGYDDG